ncbi:MAG: endonuclease III [Candidatus Thermochlorobacter aerophilum]|jgi:endonuclease-3|uniref:Endonuclease III n=1 Tax=Candidatus Thermochlorobacter aerophilus TaxID=1868324 RepID=A0A395M3Q1_9BACT|nr:MAG: endonuclease III [Candidatus Thermochlorobacter aerophilum]
MTRREKIQKVIAILSKKFPSPRSELVYQTPFQLLIATILAAQCTDKRVNLVTQPLFAKYPDAKAMSQLSLDELREHIKSINFFNNKAKNIHALVRILLEKFNGEVPDTLEALTALPGVGRKTAHVVLSNGFGKPVLAVDTHVFRVANRLGLAKAKDVLQTEKQLMRHLAPEEVNNFHHYLVLHGRYTCKAISPQCHICELTALCTHYRQLKSSARQRLASTNKSTQAKL